MKNSLVAVVKMDLVMFAVLRAERRGQRGVGQQWQASTKTKRIRCKEVSDLTTPLCEKLGISMRQQLSLTKGFVCV